MRSVLLVVFTALLAACASVSQVSTNLPEREAMRDFSLEARFSLKVERMGEAAQNGSGRLSWKHQNGTDNVFLANPLGGGLAEIDISPGGSRLRSSNGEVRQHASADVLLQQVTGYVLPVSRLAQWLLGRAGTAGEVRRDAFGRPQALLEAGWQVEYEYPDNNPTALPHLLRVNQASEVMLTLRIEEWRDAP
jgi:outer membrane lipoprotein LolB